MRLVCFSDTHKLHQQVLIPNGDILIYAGDMCGRGSEKSACKFITWLSNKPHKHKVIIAGNHDRCFELPNTKQILKQVAKENNVIYLEHEPVIINGLNFFGSPYQPEFCNWAFNVPRGERLERLWSQIPDNTDILITHGPPYGILDLVMSGVHVGCSDLRTRINNLPNLKVNIFGHIHFSYGKEIHNDVTYVNASICTEAYEPLNQPWIIDI